MSLAIVVVYIVSPENQGLLDLHLRQIEKCTTAPFTIYAGVNRLLPAYRRKLEKRANVKTFEFAPTNARSTTEHSYYLEQLTRIAITDGAAHVVTLHVDSFPTKAGWFETLSAQLSESCVIITLDPLNTACLLFHRDFYLAYKPKFLATPEEMAGIEFKQYIEKLHPGKEHPAFHSGDGYGFTAFRNGLTWHSLPSTTRADKLWMNGRIFGDLIFHLGGAENLPYLLQGMNAVPGLRRRAEMVRVISSSIMRRFVPQRPRAWLRAKFYRTSVGIPMNNLVDETTRNSRQHARMRLERKHLLASPESYLHSLRSDNQ